MKTCQVYRSENNPSRPNPALIKTGFASELMKLNPLLIAEWVFLYFLSAHLIDEISEFRIFTDLSSSIMQGRLINYSGLTPGLFKNFMASGFLFLALPAILWFFPYLLMLLNRVKISLGDYLKNFSLIFLFVYAGLFAGLIIMEIVTRFPYYKFIVHDVRGIDTIRQIITRQIEIAPLPLWTEWCLLAALVITSVTGIFLSYKVTGKVIVRFNIQKEKQLFIKTLPFVFIILFFAEVFLYKCF
jgi:hypothetical protein